MHCDRGSFSSFSYAFQFIAISWNVDKVYTIHFVEWMKVKKYLGIQSGFEYLNISSLSFNKLKGKYYSLA